MSDASNFLISSEMLSRIQYIRWWILDASSRIAFLMCNFCLCRLTALFSNVAFFRHWVWQWVRGILIRRWDHPKSTGDHFQAVSAAFRKIEQDLLDSFFFWCELTQLYCFHRSLLLSDDEEDTKRVVRSAKDKRWVWYLFSWHALKTLQVVRFDANLFLFKF